MVPGQPVFSILIARQVSYQMGKTFMNTTRTQIHLIRGMLHVLLIGLRVSSAVQLNLASLLLVTIPLRGELEVVSVGLFSNFETPPYVAWSTQFSLSCEGF